MLVLALDTSADIAVSLVDTEPVPGSASDVSVLAARRVTEGRRHAELLAPLIAEVLSEAGVDRRALGAVVVGTGPAPFTGLRAGLVTARTLAYALGIACHGVCSLDGIAAEALADGPATQEVLVAADARRREVYVARYRRSAGSCGTGGARLADVDRLAGPAVGRPQDLADDPSWAADVVVGGGAHLCAEHLTTRPAGAAGGMPPAGGSVLTGPDPAVLARLASGRLARGLELPSEPLYLRRPDVTPSAGRQRVTR